MLIY
jgi:exocyst complex component 3